MSLNKWKAWPMENLEDMLKIDKTLWPRKEDRQEHHVSDVARAVVVVEVGDKFLGRHSHELRVGLRLGSGARWASSTGAPLAGPDS